MSSDQSALHARSIVQGWIDRTFAPQHTIFTDSGTSALRLALSAAAGSEGRVALPAWGCYDLATACDGAGVDVLLYDLDPRTLGPDWASLRGVLSQGARAVVVVHFYGLPVPVSEVEALVREAGAAVIEDAAQGAGASIGGRPCGSLGHDFGVLSFGRGKGITGGRGGALLGFSERWSGAMESMATRLPPPSPGWAELPKSLIQHLLARPALYAIPSALPFLKLGETLYHPPHPPGGLPGISAGILSKTVQLAGAESARRRENAARLLGAVSGGAALRAVAPVVGSLPGYLRMPLVGAAMGPRLADDRTARALGIMPGYPRTLAELPGFVDRVRNAGVGFAGARELAARLGTMPTHGQLDPADLGRLTDWLAAAQAN